MFSFGASGKLFLVIVAFPKLYLYIFKLVNSDVVPHNTHLYVFGPRIAVYLIGETSW